MKILHINSNYLYTTLHQHLVVSLENKNVNSIIFMPHNGKKTFRISPEENVVEKPIFDNLDRIFFMRKQRKMYECFRKNISMENIDIIHAHTLFTDGFLAYKLNKEFNIPYIVAIRNTDINYFMKYKVHLRNVAMKILDNAKNIIFISESYKIAFSEKYISDSYKKTFNSKSVVIPNGIDPFWLNHKSDVKSIDVNNINVIFAGRIDKNKNISTSLNAIKELRESGLNVNFTVIGPIQDNSVFKKIQKNSFVSYHKPVDKNELIKFYRKNNIFLMPSHRETFGLVYAESMSQGLPVIYSKGEGFDKQFDNGVVGYSVKSKSVNDIKRAIVNTTKNYSEMSSNAIDNSSKYDWNAISTKYWNIYNGILN